MHTDILSKTSATSSFIVADRPTAPIRIGLFGFGVVGQGFYEIVAQQQPMPAEIVKVCVTTNGKSRPYSPDLYTYDPQDILGLEDIDVIIEAISDADAAYHIVSKALRQGRTVITANKKMLAEHLEELLALEQAYRGTLLYEAACGGAIPVLRLLDEYFGHEQISSLRAIINGTTNYILTQQYEQGWGYQQALQEAQRLGYAEANPALDVSGRDATNKACLLALQAFGVAIHPDSILQLGITNIDYSDVAYARNNNSTIKLIAGLLPFADGKLRIQVLPTFVKNTSALATISDAFNAIEFTGKYSGTHLLKGRGAGGSPTGAALYSDLVYSASGRRYSHNKYFSSAEVTTSGSGEIAVYIRAPKLRSLDTLSTLLIQRSLNDKNGVTMLATLQYDELRTQISALTDEGVSIIAVTNEN